MNNHLDLNPTKISEIVQVIRKLRIVKNMSYGENYMMNIIKICDFLDTVEKIGIDTFDYLK